MGQSTNAMLNYGYSFGGGDSAWEIAETGEYGELAVDWFNDEGEDESDDEGGFIEQAFKRLYEAIPDAPEVRYDWEREDLVKKHYGVWFESHCSGDYPMWMLTTYETTAYRGDCDVIDWRTLDEQRQREDWDGKLARAIEVLGVTPKQAQPAWLLASYWG